MEEILRISQDIEDLYQSELNMIRRLSTIK